MSIKSNIEAVIYAAEEPVTLAQLAGLFAPELPPAEPEQDENPGIVSLIEEGLLQAEAFLARDTRFVRQTVLPDDVFGTAEWISAEGDLRTLPCHLADKGGMDGFYAARFRRVS